jgi:hypothetical protein
MGSLTGEHRLLGAVQISVSEEAIYSLLKVKLCNVAGRHRSHRFLNENLPYAPT